MRRAKNHAWCRGCAVEGNWTTVAPPVHPIEDARSLLDVGGPRSSHLPPRPFLGSGAPAMEDGSLLLLPLRLALAAPYLIPQVWFYWRLLRDRSSTNQRCRGAGQTSDAYGFSVTHFGTSRLEKTGLLKNNRRHDYSQNRTNKSNSQNSEQKHRQTHRNIKKHTQ